MIANEKKIPPILFVAFLIFYVLQISPTTYKGDVIAFAIRSLENNPIFDFAFLPPSTLLNTPCLPNYHIGHTVILWLFYQIIPFSFSSIIIPSGILAAIFGALSVSISYLIWKQLNIDSTSSSISAIAIGLVPTFWEHSTIGEIHTMQMFFILSFVLFFLKDKIILSSIFFLISNLITPLSGISFGFIFLRGLNISTLKKGFLVGAISLIFYIIIYALIGADLTKLFDTGNVIPQGRGILYRIAILIFFILLNFGFFSIYIIKGIKQTFTRYKQIYIALLISAIPHLLLIFVTEGIFIELGSMQHSLFWILTFPLGLYIANFKPNKLLISSYLVISIIMTYIFWIGPHRYIGSSLNEAGYWLKKNGYNTSKIIAPWSMGLNLVSSRNGESLEKLSQYYVDEPFPDTKTIESIKTDSVLIGVKKKGKIRTFLSDANIPGFSYHNYEPDEDISNGSIEKLFENDYVIIYMWSK